MHRHADLGAKRRRGFTLLELLAALALASLVVLGSWRVLEELGVARDILQVDVAARDARENGFRSLRALISRVEASAELSQQFVGTKKGARFASWCEAPGGWLERCLVTLKLSAVSDTSVVTADAPGLRATTLWRIHGRVALVFLDATTSGYGWRSAWDPTITPPAAIGLALAHDTLVFPIASSQ